MATVIAAMSGGVDSSVAALLLQQQGHQVSGVTMDIWPSAATAAAADAARVAAQLGIEHRVIDLRQEFAEAVIGYFEGEYVAGRTPNPCVVCNRTIKFGLLQRAAMAWGADFMATGHYVRVRPPGSQLGQGVRYQLLRGIDPSKDQSYALYGLTQPQLANSLFPLGDRTKLEVRELAAAAALPVSAKPESQDLCFVPNGDYRAFLRERWSEGFESGPILDPDGLEIGTHQGIADFTVGQRRGIGLAAAEPLYVLAIKPALRAVIVGPGPLLYRKSATVSHCNWVALEALDRPMTAEVKVRYGGAAATGVLHPGPSSTEVEVIFGQPQRAITPGQAAVFYRGDVVLGGGTIQEQQNPLAGGRQAR